MANGTSVKSGAKKSRLISGYDIFQVFNYAFLIVLALSCIIPMINILSISLSNPTKVLAGEVKLLPVGFTFKSYFYVLQDKDFWRAMYISLQRIVLGGALGMFINVMMAYALSKDSVTFPKRKYYVWAIYFTMLFGGGLIPGFLVVYYTGLMHTVWALVIPGLVSAWNIILMLNFFRQLPKEMEEAAFIDGAGHWHILWKVVLPTSKPVLATVLLFTVVGHWNAWFDGVLFMKQKDYPMQTYLQSIINVDMTRLTTEQARKLQEISPQTLRCAQIFLGAVPILLVYPFLQKHFTKGLVLGSVKG